MSGIASGAVVRISPAVTGGQLARFSRARIAPKTQDWEEARNDQER